PVPDEAPSALKRLKRRDPLTVLAQDGYVHAGELEIGRHVDVGHRDEPETRVLELALEQQRDLFFDELVHALEPLALHLTGSPRGCASRTRRRDPRCSPWLSRSPRWRGGSRPRHRPTPASRAARNPGGPPRPPRSRIAGAACP